MSFLLSGLLHLLVSALVIFLCGKYMSRVYIRNFKTAFLVALALALLDFLVVGWLLKLILNILTLGIFYFTGLSFIISIVVNAILIEIVDQFSKDFDTRGFTPSLWLAILIGLANTIVFVLLF